VSNQRKDLLNKGKHAITVRVKLANKHETVSLSNNHAILSEKID